MILISVAAAKDKKDENHQRDNWLPAKAVAHFSFSSWMTDFV
jgi:hypothetical protein